MTPEMRRLILLSKPAMAALRLSSLALPVIAPGHKGLRAGSGRERAL
jgi:hypothetical protein